MMPAELVERPEAPHRVRSRRRRRDAERRPTSRPQREPKREPRRDSVRYLINLFSRHLPGQRRLVTLSLLMLGLEAGTAVFQAYPLAYLIDYLKGDRAGIDWLGDSRTATVAVLCVLIVTLAALNSFFDSLAEIFLAKGGRLFGFNLRTALFGKLQRLSLAFHDRRRTGDVLARVTGDVDALEDFVIKSFSDIIGSVMLLMFTLVFLGVRSWQMLIVAATIVPIVSVVSQWFSTRIRSTTKTLRTLDGNVATSAQDMLSSIRVIQTYGMAGYELRRFEEQNHSRVRAAMKAAFLQAEFSWVVKVLESLVICTVVLVGLQLVDGNVLSVGMLVMFVILIENMFKPTRKLVKEWGTIGRVLACSERVGELLDRPSTVADLPGAVVAPALRGEIEFDQVTFSYTTEIADTVGESTPTPIALCDVSFRIEPGQVAAIIGHTGAGKSTVLQLLPRLYDPQQGRVLLDGHDVRDFTLQSLRDRISVVLQETVLFSGTVAENIAYGRMDASRDEIIAAAKLANAHEFIDRLPDGYETMLGERGANLSGGQRQRIAIARAFIRGTPILLLDEPTTGLDVESASLVLQALRNLMHGKTTIIVSHDMRLIRASDSIVVLERGRIAEQGDHLTLLAANGLYSRMQGREVDDLSDAGLSEGEANDSGLEITAASLDLGFDRALPALAHAFDDDAMLQRISDTMIDTSLVDVVRCTAGKAASTGDGGCTLRYEVTLRPTDGSREHDVIVLARVFTEGEAAHAAFAARFAPLAEWAVGHPLLASFAHPVVVLDDLGIILSAFPLDPELPSLVDVTDPLAMHTVLRDGGIDVVSVAVVPGHYGRQHRCVIRYDIGVAQGDTPLVLWGKVAAHDVGERTSAALSALHALNDAGGVRIPTVVLHRPDLKLVVLDSLAGRPLFGQVLRAEVEGTLDDLCAEVEGDVPSPEQMVAAAAGVAALLHQTDVELDHRLDVGGLCRSLTGQITSLSPLAPALGQWLQGALDVAVADLSRTKALPATLCHGDFTYTQLLFDGSSPGLIDFDTVALAEPSVDLGHFTAYVRLSCEKAGRGATTERADELCRQFLERAAAQYQGESDVLLQRATAFELISLVRIAVHSWHKMKAARLGLVLPLIRRSVTHLSGADPGAPKETLDAIL